MQALAFLVSPPVVTVRIPERCLSKRTSPAEGRPGGNRSGAPRRVGDHGVGLSGGVLSRGPTDVG